ncbi:MAG: response regulator [Acidobacteria bacterium]|nr:response regulator [Acidobacteriota bacterium]
MTDHVPRILIVDHQATERHNLTTAIRRRLTCEIDSVANGIEALAKLSEKDFDLVLQDYDSPLLNGIETLREIRKYGKTEDLPVVILSDNPQASSLHELIALNVADYIVKPYSDEAVIERVIKLLATRKGQQDRRTHLPVQQPSTTDNRLVLLVTDRDTHFRHFLKSMLSSNFKLVEASNGAEAILMALKHHPNAVLAGHELGAITGEKFASKLREIAGVHVPLLIAVVLQGESERSEPPPGYDAFIIRSMVPETFLKYFNRLFFTEEDYVDRLRSLIPNLQLDLFSAVEQIVGMMMHSEVTPSEQPLTSDPDCPMISASIDVADGTRDLRVTVRIQCPRITALTLTSLMLEMPENEISDDELITSTMQEMANLIGGRLKHSFSEMDIKFSLKLPAVREELFSALVPLPGNIAESTFSAQGRAPFTVVVGVTACARIKVMSTELKPGMILSEDMAVAKGKIPKGHRLVSSQVLAIVREKARELEVVDG